MNMKKNTLLAYTWPIFLEYIMQLLVTNIDKIMVNTMSETAVSSISNATTVLDVLLITFSVISLAITIIAAQYLGKGEKEEVSKVYSLGLVVISAISIVLTIVLLIFGRSIFIAIQVPPECLEDSVIYLNIIAIGLLFQGLYAGLVAIFRSQGWMKRALYVSTFINVANIIGNYILIYGFGPIPALGVAGAAISSLIARILGFVALYVIFKRNSSIPLNFKALRVWPTELMKRMLYIGLPSGGESISYNASQMIILMFINTFGNAVVKLRSFACMFQMCSYMYASSISTAAQVVVSNIMGKGDLDGAEKEVKHCLKIAISISALTSLALFIFSDQVYGLFISDPELLHTAKILMGIGIILEISRAVNMTLVRCLQAAGDTIYPMTVGIIFMWGCATFLSWLLGVVFNMGIVGVWIAMCLDETIRAFLFMARFKKGKWRENKVMQ